MLHTRSSLTNDYAFNLRSWAIRHNERDDVEYDSEGRCCGDYVEGDYDDDDDDDGEDNSDSEKEKDDASPQRCV